MKKTIAKIMAAAMVLSTVAAPNALAATYDGTTAVKIADMSIGGRDFYSNGDATGSNFDISLVDSSDVSILAAHVASANSGAADSFETVPASEGLEVYVNDELGGGTIAASVYTTAAVATNDAIDSSNAAAVTSVTSETKSKLTKTTINAGSTDNLIQAMTDGKASKVTVNGEYNDVVTGDNGGLRRMIRLQNVNGRLIPQWNFRYEKFGEWLVKIGSGAIVTGTVNVVDANNVIRGTRNIRWFVRDIANANDDYWNAIVKLKSSNNRYVPIRVHVAYANNSGDNLGLFAQIVNNTTIRGLNWVNVGTTAGLTVAELANRRLELQDVNTYDYDLIKSDIAKGKNLMLDKAYIFTTADAANDNGFYSAWTGYEDFFRLGVDTDLSTTSIGKIDKIHASLFKKGKFKLVNAENAKFINNGAFRECKQLKKAIIGSEKNMKKVNTKAFYKCKKLATVKISGKQLKRVGKDAFKECKSNMIFKIKGNATQVKKAAKMLLKQAPSKAKYAKI